MAKTAEYKLGEYTFPRGWFVVAEATQVGTTPLNERYFEEDVIIYRGSSGKVVMLDAYCPHMGTHLGRNKTSALVVNGNHLDGDCIRCPFHGWKFGPDGKCKEIPFHDGPIPPKAAVKSWYVEERYGLVFCWYDPEGLEPSFPLPDYPEWDSPQWVRWIPDHLGTLPVHPQEILDNTADVRHLTALHGAGAIRWYENEADGPYLYQRQGAQTAGAGGATEGLSKFSTLVRYVGPSLLTSRFYLGDSDDHNIAQLIAHTPVEDGTIRLWHCSMMRSMSGVVDDTARAMAKGANEQLKHGFMEDFEVWANKRPAVQIMQIPSDGPFGRNRVWYSQFYNPREKAEQILARAAGIHGARGTPTIAQYASAAEPANV
jgi:3-ketosteroid 9alpha-monooxygenase subunit A